MLKIALKASLITLGIIIIGQAEAVWTLYTVGENPSLSVMAVHALLPMLTAFPACFIIFWQNERLKNVVSELSLLNEQLCHKANHDQMTGLLNREAFLDRFKEARRGQDTGALLMIDADHFKAINDEYGHLSGDEALKLIAHVIQASVRDQDVIGRIGGEEFCVFLPATNRAEALMVAERIRFQVERISYFPEPTERRPLTVSIGVAYTVVRQPIARLMRQADVSLYEAKKLGRNRVVINEATKLAA